MKKKRSVRTRQCIFCGSLGPGVQITGEHLWSAWMAKYLGPDDPKAERIEFMEDLESEESMLPFKIESTKLGAANKKKIPVVCDTCNTGWMSGIENETKQTLVPLITGQQTILDDASIQKLLRFVALKTMVAEHDAFKGRNTMPIYDEEDRKRFMDKRAAPEGMWVWLGPCGGPKWRTGFYRFVSGVRLVSASLGSVIEPNFVRRGANIHSVTWGIGGFFFHVVATTNMEFYMRHIWEIPNGLVPIWPQPIGRISWEPNFAFCDWSIDNMATALREVSKTFKKIGSDGTLLP